MGQGLYLITQMQNGTVVVALVFQFKCFFCSAEATFPEDERWLQSVICLECKMPQPWDDKKIDYFETFGLKRCFSLLKSEVERRFYQLSKLLHPDRFTTKGNDAQALSLKKMSEVNQAYSTLKNKASLREYLIQLEGIQVLKGFESSKELAEKWFDMKEIISEMEHHSPLEALAQVEAFKKESLESQSLVEKNIQTLERKYDELLGQCDFTLHQIYSENHSEDKSKNKIADKIENKKEVLEKIADELQRLNFFQAAQNDIDRVTIAIQTLSAQ